jgi:hypothetical protein
MDVAAKIREITDRSVRTGTARDAVNESEELQAIFSKMTPEEKAIGKLVGKILQAHSYNEIEAAWAWYEVEFANGVQLTYRQKMLVLFQAAETLDCTQAQYNLIRKMYLTVNNR